MKKGRDEGKHVGHYAHETIVFTNKDRVRSPPRQAHPDADERSKQKQPARPVTNMGLSAPIGRSARKSYISG